ncbi:MAG: hypothetical protein WD295_06490, partial [Bacteroidota bacterium]
MILVIVSMSLSWAGCSRSIDPPPEERNPRNYTWVRDTLGDGTFQSVLQSIWGSSPADVYVVGHSSSTWEGKIWHFNGVQWSDITYAYVQAFQEFQGFGFTPVQVFGFGANDVWIVGLRDTSHVPQENKKGFVLRFDGGETWKGFWLPTA